jgi:hypothetical protein
MIRPISHTAKLVRCRTDYVRHRTDFAVSNPRMTAFAIPGFMQTSARGLRA